MIVWFQCTVSRYPAVLSMIGCGLGFDQSTDAVCSNAAAGPTTTNHRQASIRRGAGATGAEAVQRPASLHHPWLLINCRLLLCMRAVCTTTTGTSRSPCA